jgi:hypothetical protein
MGAKIAASLEEFELTLDNKPLNENNYKSYYIDATAGRGGNPTNRLIRQIKNNKEKNFKILLAGFKGCGKSTELLRLKLELENDFIIDIFSVREKLDPNNFSISELLIAITTDLLIFVHKNHDSIQLSKELMTKLENWSEKTLKEKVSYNYAERQIGAGVNVNAGLGKILNFFAKLSFDFQSGRKFTEITSIETEKTLSDLILHCNLIVEEIKKQLDTIKKSNIIIIVEDLEKVHLDITEKLFFNYSRQLTSIACGFIYTFPISLVFNPMYNIIIQEFDGHQVLPMIKVHDKEWKDYQPGVRTILNIIDRRIDKTRNLIPPELLKNFIRMSSGSLRDLFRMLNLAAANALDYKKERIEEIDYKYSVDQLKNDFYNTISYNEKNQMTPQDYYELLVKCHKDKEKKPMNDRGMLDLRHNMCVLGYNSESWYDVHTVVKEILKEKKMI